MNALGSSIRIPRFAAISTPQTALKKRAQLCNFSSQKMAVLWEDVKHFNAHTATWTASENIGTRRRLSNFGDCINRLSLQHRNETVGGARVSFNLTRTCGSFSSSVLFETEVLSALFKLASKLNCIGRKVYRAVLRVCAAWQRAWVAAVQC